MPARKATPEERLRGPRGGTALRCLTAWLALFLLQARAVAQEEGAAFELTQELLARIADEAKPLVREALGVELASVEVRLATRDEIRAALQGENLALFEHLGQPRTRALEQAAGFAESMAPALFAKYALESDDVLVQGEAFTRLADLTGIPGLASEQTLRAVILHELVHAADDERYDLSAFLRRGSDVDAVRACNAVMEGHAQLVARELAPRLGCAEGFATYTRAITAPPRAVSESGDASAEMVLKTASQFITSSYTEGETFMAALRKAGGEEAVRRAFLEPPCDAVLIARPEWFLHPELRPSSVFELEPALDAFVAAVGSAGWTPQRLSVSQADLRTSLAPLPPEEIETLGATIRQNRVQSLTDTRRGSQLVLGLFEFGTPAEAAAYLASYERLQHLRDETMKEGAFRILSSDYESLEPPDPTGLLVEKRIQAGVTLEVRALCIVRGTLSLEMLAVTLPEWDGERMLASATKALDDVLSHPRPAEPAGAGR